MVVKMTKKCPKCNGKKLIDEEDCNLCDGFGFVDTRCKKCGLRIRGPGHLEGSHHKGRFV